MCDRRKGWEKRRQMQRKRQRTMPRRNLFWQAWAPTTAATYRRCEHDHHPSFFGNHIPLTDMGQSFNCHSDKFSLFNIRVSSQTVIKPSSRLKWVLSKIPLSNSVYIYTVYVHIYIYIYSFNLLLITKLWFICTHSLSNAGWPKEGKKADREREKEKGFGWKTQASKHWSSEWR